VKGRLLGFSLVPLLGSLAPLLILPLVARVASVEQWTAVGSGQALGAMLAVCVGLGWTLVGPARLARTSRAGRNELWWDSIFTRGFVLIGCVPAAAVCALFLAPFDSWPLASLATLSVAVTGLSCAWHAVGVGAPRYLVYFDALPKVVALAVSAGALALTSNLYVYLILMMVAALISPIGYSWLAEPRSTRRHPRLRRVWRLVKAQGQALGANVLTSVQSTAPVLVAATLAPPVGVASLVSGDKIYRAGLIATQTLTNAGQSWVLEGRPLRPTRRILIFIGMQGALGVIGLLGLILMGPWVTSVAFGPKLAATPQACAAYGVAYLLLCVNSSFRVSLIVPWLGARAALLCSVAAVTIGIPVMAALCLTVGAAGAAAGLAAGEASSLFVGMILLLRRRAIK